MNAIDISLRSVQLQNECHQELITIADWWVKHTQDNEQGGFYGEIAVDNTPVKTASKGVILNTRILWFFSEVAQEIENPAYLAAAERAYVYLLDYFIDREFGGVYWELDASGKPINTKKQIYAQAFAIYALCAYYKLTNNSDALKQALSCFELIERHAIDRQAEGYIEAYTREWGMLEDYRLSVLDLNYPKSQNTHLHILEAYTSLYELVSSETIGNALRYSIKMFDQFMIDRDHFHLRMFMDMQWKDFSPGFTYGHDIEAVWLLAKALDVLGDQEYKDALLPTLLKIAEINLQQAVADDGHIKDAYDYASKTVRTESTWWVQAEGLVGYIYCYAVTGNLEYFSAAEKLWQFIKTHQIDSENGEWLWWSRLDAQPAVPHYKVGFWKCPYHNGRTMMEVKRFLKQTSP